MLHIIIIIIIIIIITSLNAFWQNYSQSTGAQQPVSMATRYDVIGGMTSSYPNQIIACITYFSY